MLPQVLPTQTVGVTTSGQFDTSIFAGCLVNAGRPAFNKGLLERCRLTNYPATFSNAWTSGHSSTAFITSNITAQPSVDIRQNYMAAKPTTTTYVAPGANASSVTIFQWMATIRLGDLHDFFAQLKYPVKNLQLPGC